MQEVELKLTIAQADAAKLADHPLLRQHANAPPHTEDLVSTYFDTADHQLQRHGACLRLRQTGHGCIQTLKTDGSVAGGLFQRDEIEARVDGPGIDLAALRAGIGKHSRWRKVLHSPSLRDALQPLFDTRVSRTIWELRLPDGAEIEFALDRGAIECGAERADVSEAELELKAGDVGALHRFALELLDSVPMSLAASSKSERGYALCDGAQAAREPVKFGGLQLAPDMTVEQAFRHIIDACLAQVLGNADGVVHGADPEHVHQMRVGMRRLRSALGLFKKLVPVPAALEEELGWLGAALGAARDWEVLAHTTLGPVQEGAPGDTAALGLPQAAATVAADKRAQAAAAVQSVRYTKLILSFQRWLHEAAWRTEIVQWKRARLDSRLQRFAARELERSRRRLLKRGARLRGADAAARHRVRIAAKKARYAMEFFASLYAGRQVKKYIRALAGLQDELGRLNDAAVADGLLLELAISHPDLGPATGFARGYLAAAVEHAAKPLRRQWKRFRRVDRSLQLRPAAKPR